ncbi:retrovirus-related pol polyprotein from transposon TNT 1-94 [Tanacetum coccineum]
MIGREILGSFCVNYFEFELLKEENPPEQSHLGIFFSKEIFEGGVIRIHNAFVQDECIGLKCLSNGNVVAARAEGNGNGNNGYQIRYYNCRGLGHYARNCTIRPMRRDAAYLQTHLLIAQKEEAGIQL